LSVQYASWAQHTKNRIFSDSSHAQAPALDRYILQDRSVVRVVDTVSHPRPRYYALSIIIRDPLVLDLCRDHTRNPLTDQPHAQHARNVNYPDKTKFRSRVRRGKS